MVLRGYKDSFEQFGVIEFTVHNISGESIGLMCRYKDSTETAMIIPNNHALKLADWIIKNVK